MFTSAGILLFLTGASLTFAVERQLEEVDLQLVGWIMMAGGVTALVFAITRFAGLVSEARTAHAMQQIEQGDASAVHHLDPMASYGRLRLARGRSDRGWAT